MNRRGFFGAIAAALGCARAPGVAQELQDIRRMGEHAFRPTHLMVPKPDHVAVYDFAIGNDLPTVTISKAMLECDRFGVELRGRCAHCGVKVTLEEAWAHGDCRQREEEGAGEGTLGPVSPPSGPSGEK